MKVLRRFMVVSILAIVFSFVFKILHWPGYGLLRTAGIIGLLISIVGRFIYNRRTQEF